MRPRAAAVLAALVLTATGGCGGGASETLKVGAASSLKKALATYDASFQGAHVAVTPAGSDQLAAQVRAGAPLDVLVAADVRIAAQLHAAGLVDAPVRFATNRLVLAVPAGGSRVMKLADLARPGVRIVLGSATVPVGAYARKALALLGRTQARKILANVRSNEPDAAAVVGKLAAGAGDAGLVYASDVHGAGGRLRAIALPAQTQPRIVYAAAVVRRSSHHGSAGRWVAGLRSPAGRRALRSAGVPPLP